MAPAIVGAAPAPESPRRALALAGGGLRLSWQAGVLRALLEAGLRFHLVDATSAGGLNAAMWLSGQSPEEMGERWRAQRPLQALGSRAPWDYLRPWRLTSMGAASGFRDRVVQTLGIDLERVRGARDVEAWFNVLNYTRMAVECVPHTAIDEDLLIAGLSLPGILPPVQRDGSLYLDAGFVRDANPLEAVRRGADELWVAWAMASSPRYRGGPLQLYVQALEMSANTTLHEDVARVAEMNEQIGRGERPFGRSTPVAVHVIRPARRLPLDADLYSRRTSHAALVDQGYQDAWRYLDGVAAPGAAPTAAWPEPVREQPGVTYRAAFRGPFALGVADPIEGGRRGREAGSQLALHVAVSVLDLAALRSGTPGAASVAGRLDGVGLATGVPARQGTLSLLRARGSSSERGLEYELTFVVDGRSLYLLGRSTAGRGALAATLHEGGRDGEVVGAGVLTLGAGGLVRLGGTLRSAGTEGPLESLRVLARSLPVLARHLTPARE